MNLVISSDIRVISLDSGSEEVVSFFVSTGSEEVIVPVVSMGSEEVVVFAVSTRSEEVVLSIVSKGMKEVVAMILQENGSSRKDERRLEETEQSEKDVGGVFYALENLPHKSPHSFPTAISH
jgi:hypothetical protein